MPTKPIPLDTINGVSTDDFASTLCSLGKDDPFNPVYPVALFHLSRDPVERCRYALAYLSLHPDDPTAFMLAASALAPYEPSEVLRAILDNGWEQVRSQGYECVSKEHYYNLMDRVANALSGSKAPEESQTGQRLPESASAAIEAESS